MNWTESTHCGSRAHCTACRNDRTFRDSIVRAGMADTPDFACPAGFRIGCGPVNPKPAPAGPGAVLKRLLQGLGIKPGANCNCTRRAAEMDRRGVDWCRRNVEVITAWLEEEAGKRALPFNRYLAASLVRLAIRRARTALKRSQ